MGDAGALSRHPHHSFRESRARMGVSKACNQRISSIRSSFLAPKYHDERNLLWRPNVDSRRRWLDLVERYSVCELTFSSDKLVALSGIISALRNNKLISG